MKNKNRIRQLRTERGMVQEELGNIIGVTKQCVSQWENGRRSPDPQQLEALADYFNVDMDFLTGRSFVTKTITNDEEQRILRAFRQADDITKEMVLRILGINEKKGPQ